MNRENLLMQLMQLDFARYDLRLYLNTHPGDREAIARYNNLTKEVDLFRAEFEKEFGAMSHRDTSNEDCFMWIENPWPWDREFLKKGEK